MEKGERIVKVNNNNKKNNGRDKVRVRLEELLQVDLLRIELLM